MKLIELTICNFMPYRQKQVVRFPTDSQQNVVLVFGDNMRGKTSFLNAIRWVLYGTAKARNGRAIPRIDLVNSNEAAAGNWAVSVSLKFAAFGQDYDLRRTLDRRRAIITPRSAADFEESLVLSKSGEIVRRDLIEHEINQVIPEQISRFFLFDGELLQEYETLLDDQSAQGRRIKEAIEKVLGVPALIRAREHLEMLVREAQKRQSKELEKEKGLKDLISSQTLLENEVAAIEADLAKLQAARDKADSEIRELDVRLSATKEAEQAQGELNSLESELKDLERREREGSARVSGLLETAWLDLIRPRILAVQAGLLAEAEDSAKRNSAKQKLLHTVQTKEQLLATQDCPTCHQPTGVSPATRVALNQELEDLRKQLDEHADPGADLVEVHSRLREIEGLRSSAEGDKITASETALLEIAERRIQVETRQAELEDWVAGFDTAEIARLRDRQTRLHQEVGRLGLDIGRASEELATKLAKIERLSDLISRSQEGKRSRSSQSLERYKQLKEVFRLSIDQYRDSVRSRVADEATAVFKELTTEADYSSLSINASYGLQIMDRAGRTIRERSAGAEQIVALSLIQGLNRVARRSGPIVMDTSLARLDPSHRQNLFKVLPRSGEQLVLLVHEGEIDRRKIDPALTVRTGLTLEIQRVSGSESRIVSA